MDRLHINKYRDFIEVYTKCLVARSQFQFVSERRYGSILVKIIGECRKYRKFLLSKKKEEYFMGRLHINTLSVYKIHARNILDP